MKRAVTIAGREVELKLTLLSLKRLRQATGKNLQQIRQELVTDELDLETAVPALLWAMVGHDPELRKLSEDEIAASIDAATLEGLSDAIADAWVGEDNAGPPAQAGTETATPAPPTR